MRPHSRSTASKCSYLVFFVAGGNIPLFPSPFHCSSLLSAILHLRDLYTHWLSFSSPVRQPRYIPPHPLRSAVIYRKTGSTSCGHQLNSGKPGSAVLPLSSLTTMKIKDWYDLDHAHSSNPLLPCPVSSWRFPHEWFITTAKKFTPSCKQIFKLFIEIQPKLVQKRIFFFSRFCKVALFCSRALLNITYEGD